MKKTGETDTIGRIYIVLGCTVDDIMGFSQDTDKSTHTTRFGGLFSALAKPTERKKIREDIITRLDSDANMAKVEIFVSQTSFEWVLVCQP